QLFFLSELRISTRSLLLFLLCTNPNTPAADVCQHQSGQSQRDHYAKADYLHAPLQNSRGSATCGTKYDHNRCSDVTHPKECTKVACAKLASSDTAPVRVSESEGTLLLYIFSIATACAGLLNLPVWTALIGGTAIAGVSIVEQAKLRTRFAAIVASDVLTTAHLASLAMGWIAGIACWALGRFSLWAYWS